MTTAAFVTLPHKFLKTFALLSSFPFMDISSSNLTNQHCLS